MLILYAVLLLYFIYFVEKLSMLIAIIVKNILILLSFTYKSYFLIFLSRKSETCNTGYHFS